jgi:4-hydroxy-tetrahydrodipicolinate synthase
MYNIPGRVVIKMSVETIVRLSQIDNIIGVKEASGDMGLVSHTLSKTSEDFLIWSGNDNDTFHIMALGGYGTIGVVTHLVGKQVKQMMDNLINGKLTQAAAIHRRLVPLVDALFIEPNPAPLKYALNHLGFNVGKPRLPLVEPSEQSAKTIRETLKNHRIDLPI